MGRPPGGIMTQAEKTHVCEQIADGRSLTDIVQDDEIIVEIRTIYRELNRDSFFLSEYARAREASIEIKLSETEDIILGKGDFKDVNFERAKELLNDRRWHAIRLARFRYGDKIDVQATVKQVEGKVIDAKVLDVDQLLAIRQALQIAAGGGDGYEEDEDYEYEGQDDSGEDEGLAED